MLKIFAAKNPGEFNYIIDEAINKCSQKLSRVFEVKELRQWGKNKYWIPVAPSQNGKPRKCIGVSIGIGYDIESEKAVRAQNSDCELFGADPVQAAGEVFEEVGRYYEVAVAGQSKVGPATIMTSQNSYKTRLISLTGLEKFAEFIGYDVFDYLWIDNEGLEYEIMRQLSKLGNKITACQINVEFHSAKDRMNVFNDLLKNIISSSGFIPIWGEELGVHYRLFFVNLHSPYCCSRFSTWE